MCLLTKVLRIKLWEEGWGAGSQDVFLPRIQSLCRQDPTPSYVLPITALSQDCNGKVHLHIHSSKYRDPARDPHTAGPQGTIVTTIYQAADSAKHLRMS